MKTFKILILSPWSTVGRWARVGLDDRWLLARTGQRAGISARRYRSTRVPQRTCDQGVGGIIVRGPGIGPGAGRGVSVLAQLPGVDIEG